MKRKKTPPSECAIPKKKMKTDGKKQGKEVAVSVATPQLELSDNNKLLAKGAKDIEMEDSRAWESTGRARTVRGGVIFGMLSVLHYFLATYFHDDKAAPGYALLALVSFAMAAYASCAARTERAFNYALRIVLLLLSISRIAVIAGLDLSVDCLANVVGSTCTQLRQRKYPMRWAMDSISFVTLASSLKLPTFAILACIEIMWAGFAIGQVNPSNVAEQGAAAEVVFGLIVVILCTCNQLRAHETMRKAIYYRERTDRIVNHRIKNILADTYSTLLLYPKGEANLQDLQRSAISVQRASRSIQNSLNLSQLLNPELRQPASMDRNAREVKLSSWIREHGPAHGFNIFSEGCKLAESFIMHEILAAELFLDLTLDNAALHGGGDTRVDCYFEDGAMRIDVNNKIADAEDASTAFNKKDRLQHREFSTCLGNHDLVLVCSKRKIAFESGKRGDGRWHACIAVAAVRLSAQNEVSVEIVPARTLVPHNLRVAVMDDVRMIVRLCKMQLQTKLHARVEGYHVDTLAAYNEFVDVTIHENKNGWDIVVLDQHLGLKCGMLKRGTEIMDLLRDSGACLIMHTGNNSAQDCDKYALHGCHGVVGKGEVFCERVAQIYLDYVSQMKK